jgi:hypothetical protein
MTDPEAVRCALSDPEESIAVEGGPTRVALECPDRIVGCPVRALLLPPGLALVAGAFIGCAELLAIDDLPAYPPEAGTTNDAAVPKEDAAREAGHASDGAIDGGAPTHKADVDGGEVSSFVLQDIVTGYDWDVGENHFSGDQYLRLYPSAKDNAYQDFEFTAVPGVTNGYTICNVAVALCLRDGGGEVVLDASGDTWITTASGTLQNHVSKRYIEAPTGDAASGAIVTTGSVPARWSFLPPH